MYQITIVTWNVNSIRKRIQDLKELINDYRPDVILLQETKVADTLFPDIFQICNYYTVFMGQKAYNGVAILTPHTVGDIQYNNNIDHAIFQEARYVSCDITINDLNINCNSIYVPNGRDINHQSFSEKMIFLNGITELITHKIQKYNGLVCVGGDFNIAATDNDIHDSWTSELLCSPAERAAFTNIKKTGLKDMYMDCHLHTPIDANNKSTHYTWWDYRAISYQRKLGARIDYVLATDKFTAQKAAVLTSFRSRSPCSDHAPVLCTMNIICQ